VLLVLFLVLIVGPIVAGDFIDINKMGLHDSIPMELLQPVGYSNNDTSAKPTGSCIHGKCPEYHGGVTGGGGGGGDDPATATATSSDAAARFRRYMAY
jgi:1,3-beta-glucan synthase